MATDIRKLNLDDLIGRLFFACRNCEWDGVELIKAEIARRIEVRDIVVRDLLRGKHDAIVYAHFIGDGASVKVHDKAMIYELNGEQIL